MVSAAKVPVTSDRAIRLTCRALNEAARASVRSRAGSEASRRASVPADSGRVVPTWTAACSPTPAATGPRNVGLTSVDVRQLLDHHVEPLALDELHGVEDGVPQSSEQKVGLSPADRRSGIGRTKTSGLRSQSPSHAARFARDDAVR